LITLGATGIVSILGANFTASQPAEARPACMYIARDAAGNFMAQGNAWAMKKSWACNRARRRCNRELERKRRHGKAGRGQCVRIENYG